MVFLPLTMFPLTTFLLEGIGNKRMMIYCHPSDPHSYLGPPELKQELGDADSYLCFPSDP